MEHVHTMKKLGALLFSSALAAAPVAAKIKVAASLTDLASIASYVGGGEVEVFSIAKANSNPHFVEVLPSYMIKVSRVDVYLKAGLALDQWADAIIEGSRNNKLAVIDCSAGVEVLEKPSGKVDASMGDVHPQGNPHYWLDPANGPLIAEHVREALSKADPAHAALFAANAKKFREESDRKIAAWNGLMAPLKGSAVVTYHSSWVYFAKAYGLRIVGYVEPFPGIPPTAKHLQELVDRIKAGKAKVLIQEPYYGDSDPRFLERQTGIKVYRFTPSCVGTGAGDYFRHFDAMTEALAKAGG
ncbi:MAG TPA: metal ABC transporter substrate-binding protein [Fibrobacteria bacterium]|nr:metal ABC transporter substrate-binding protein [Fibrobacteria bacterium]